MEIMTKCSAWASVVFGKPCGCSCSCSSVCWVGYCIAYNVYVVSQCCQYGSTAGTYRSQASRKCTWRNTKIFYIWCCLRLEVCLLYVSICLRSDYPILNYLFKLSFKMNVTSHNSTSCSARKYCDQAGLLVCYFACWCFWLLHSLSFLASVIITPQHHTHNDLDLGLPRHCWRIDS